MKETEILRAWVTADGLLQIQLSAHPEVSDARREECAKDVAEALLGLFDSDPDAQEAFEHLSGFIDIRH